MTQHILKYIMTQKTAELLEMEGACEVYGSIPCPKKHTMDDGGELVLPCREQGRPCGSGRSSPTRSGIFQAVQEAQ